MPADASLPGCRAASLPMGLAWGVPPGESEAQEEVQEEVQVAVSACSQFFVDALIASLEDLEARLFGIGYRQGLAVFRRVDLADQFLHGLFAQRADLEGWTVDRPSQFESPGTNAAALFVVDGDVFVDRHGRGGADTDREEPRLAFRVVQWQRCGRGPSLVFDLMGLFGWEGRSGRRLGMRACQQPVFAP